MAPVSLLPMGRRRGDAFRAGRVAGMRREPSFDPGEHIWVGLDVGGERSATAVVWISESLDVGVWIGHGDAAVLEAGDVIRDLAERYTIRELVHDPWRAQQLALELEREGMRVVQVPQSDSRMIPASERLHRSVAEERLTLPDDPELERHAANAIARETRRGWRLDKRGRTDSIDALVALAMALERADAMPEPVRVLGWL